MAVLATYKLEVDWDNDGTFGNVNADLVAASNVFSVTCRRGRDYASQLTGRSIAGKLTAQLYNPAGIYSPFNASSPVTGKILPGRAVRLRAVYSAVTYVIWYGYLDSITPSTAPGPFPTAVLSASGGLLKLSGKSITPAADAGSPTGTIMSAILTAAGWGGGSDVDTGIVTTSPWYVKDKDALNAAREIEETEFGFLFEQAGPKLTYEDCHHRLTAVNCTTSQRTFSDAGGAAYPYVSIAEQDPWKNVYNEFLATVTPYSIGALAVLWTLIGETPTLNPGETKIFWAQYPSSGTLVTNGAYVNAWTTPVVGTDITQTGVANGDIGVAVSKFAEAMKISITNNNLLALATLTLVQARGTPVTEGTATQVTDEDATSEATYGKRTYRLPGRWFPSTPIAQSFCGYGVSRYKDTLAVLTLGVVANRDANMMIDALTRTISDRVTVTANGNATLGLSQDFFIESIAHSIMPGRLHRTTYEMSPAGGDAGYWVLGVSTLGGLTKLCYP